MTIREKQNEKIVTIMTTILAGLSLAARGSSQQSNKSSKSDTSHHKAQLNHNKKDPPIPDGFKKTL